MPTDYFRYFPISPEMARWGLAVTATGFASISPGETYPPRLHPADHFFDWTHGRTLDSLQVLLITAGSGMLETHATGLRRVEAGMAFLLLPRTWHRYRPDPAAGWDESWVEIAGPVVDQLHASGLFSAETILRTGAIEAGMDDAFESLHRLAIQEPVGFQPELSAAALRILALCARITASHPQPSRMHNAVLKAEQYLTAHHAEPVNIEALAHRLGVAYSHFRRAFRAHTGFAPWQYVLHLRLSRARRLLASSPAKLEDIAERVGFASAFHLSLAFKKAFGQAPAHWRQSLDRNDQA